MKKVISILMVLTLFFSFTAQGAFAAGEGYLLITDAVAANSGVDVSDEIQRFIDENPNRTIFFPDGEYLLSKPIYTPADPKKSVSLKLADFAVISPTGDWQKGEALIQLGGKDPKNDIYTIGSNYSLEGGAIDGKGVANGISINGGRETAVRNVSMKHTVVGLHIKYGANGGSSDCDISGINIIGTGTTDSVGILVEGWDNTIKNSRIARVQYGMHIKSAGNIFRDIHPLYTSNYTDYTESCAFFDECGGNVYDYCYSDQFAIGFRLTNNSANRYTNCFCWWYSNDGGTETAFKADEKFCSVVSDFRVDFRDGTQNNVLKVGEIGGDGHFDNLIVGNEDSLENKVYKAYENTENIFQRIVKVFWKIAAFFIVAFQ